MQLRLIQWSLGALLASVLAACGGGGDEAGDVTGFSVLEPSMTWTAASCPAGVVDAVSIHTINGGQPPFRVRASVDGLEVGLTNASNEFVPAPLNAEGDLVLTGKDPKFAIRTTLPCPSDVTVRIFDYHSRTTAVSIKVEGSETATP